MQTSFVIGKSGTALSRVLNLAIMKFVNDQFNLQVNNEKITVQIIHNLCTLLVELADASNHIIDMMVAEKRYFDLKVMKKLPQHKELRSILTKNEKDGLNLVYDKLKEANQRASNMGLGIVSTSPP